MKVELKTEALKSTTDGDNEILELSISAELTCKLGEKGATTELRKAVQAGITRLVNILTDTKKETDAPEIMVEYVTPDGTDYRISQKTFGNGVPDIDSICKPPITKRDMITMDEEE